MEINNLKYLIQIKEKENVIKMFKMILRRNLQIVY